jgi:hypothetical protein
MDFDDDGNVGFLIDCAAGKHLCSISPLIVMS